MALTLPRVCHAGMRGPDVLAYSRTYRRLGIRQRDATRFFGMRMVGNTKHFQHDHQLKQTGTVNKDTFDQLRRHFDNYDKYLIGRAESKYEVTPRDLVVGYWLAMLRVAPCPYIQIRPYPMSIERFDHDGSDCSGTFELAYKLAHDHDPSIPDPSALHFDGYGYTGTLLAHGRRVATPKPGDAVFFYPDYHHVGGFLGGSRVFSHGGTGDPHITSVTYGTQFRSYLD